MTIKKIFSTLIILLSLLLLQASLVKINAAEDDEIDAEKNAYIYVRTNNDHLPVFYVKDSEIPVYEHEGEETLDFRRYFHIIDQRMDILKMRNLVDGANMPIDRGGYEWNFGTFDISVPGDYTIAISYKGANGVVISSSIKITVIEEDTIPPAIYGLFASVNVDVKADFIDSIVGVSAVDNVDGLIQLSLDNFSGHENIKGSPLGSEHTVTLTVSDRAGNVTIRMFIATVKDLVAPIIKGAVNLETKVGKPIEYKAHLIFEDNHTSPENITKEFVIVTDESGDTPTGETEIDFNKVGENYIKVVATDEGGARATKIYRVIVKDSVSLGMMIVYINASILGLGVVTVGTFYLVSKFRK